MVNDILPNGAVFHHLTVMSFKEAKEIGHKHFMHYYLCKCICGNQIVVSQGELVSGHVKSCGCVTSIRKQPLKYDLKGQRFGRLVVESQAETFWSNSGKSRMIRWNCVCDCGNQVVVNSRALRTGATLSCGCYQKERVSETLVDDLMHQRFGTLTVIERAGSRIRQNSDSGVAARWKCRCDCGNEIITDGWSLKCGDIVSCGCAKTSMAEMLVDEILNKYGFELGVSYFREQTFPDLISSFGGFLRFDFVIHTKQGVVYLECQGEQHYKVVDYFGGQEAFDRRVKNDALKKKWVSEKQGKLIEIPYTLHTYDEILDVLVTEHIIELVNRVSE